MLIIPRSGDSGRAFPTSAWVTARLYTASSFGHPAIGRRSKADNREH